MLLGAISFSNYGEIFLHCFYTSNLVLIGVEGIMSEDVHCACEKCSNLIHHQKSEKRSWGRKMKECRKAYLKVD